VTTTVPVISPTTITTQNAMFFIATTPLRRSPHVKKRIVPKRRQVGLVPCTDKIGHQSVGAPDRAGCPARRVGVDRTPGLRPTRRECSLPRRGEAGQELLSHKGRVLPRVRARARVDLVGSGRHVLQLDVIQIAKHPGRNERGRQVRRSICEARHACRRCARLHVRTHGK
jgi:hypothetical protein